MKNTEIRAVKPPDYAQVAQTYAQVFAGEPWREVSQCAECGKFSPTAAALEMKCACGGTYSKDAYPLAQTTEYVAQETTRDGSVALVLTQLALAQEALVKGFSWGFKLDGAAFAAEKYKTQEMQQVIGELLTNAGFFYYISEVGILPEVQGNGFGKALTKQLVAEAERQGYRQFVVRTNEDSVLRYILEGLGMQPVVGLQTGIRDTENEARVVFVAQR